MSLPLATKIVTKIIQESGINKRMPFVIQGVPIKFSIDKKISFCIEDLPTKVNCDPLFIFFFVKKQCLCDFFQISYDQPFPFFCLFENKESLLTLLF